MKKTGDLSGLKIFLDIFFGQLRIHHGRDQEKGECGRPKDRAQAQRHRQVAGHHRSEYVTHQGKTGRDAERDTSFFIRHGARNNRIRTGHQTTDRRAVEETEQPEPPDIRREILGDEKEPR